MVHQLRDINLQELAGWLAGWLALLAGWLAFWLAGFLAGWVAAGLTGQEEGAELKWQAIFNPQIYAPFVRFLCIRTLLGPCMAQHRRTRDS